VTGDSVTKAVAVPATLSNDLELGIGFTAHIFGWDINMILLKGPEAF
jgi:hypothetical protein